MADRAAKSLVWWALVGALGLSSALAIRSELSWRRLVSAYAKAKAEVAHVAQERDHLNQELAGARQVLEDQASQLAGLQAELDQAERDVSRVRQEHARLQQTTSGLTAQLASATQAKAALEANLSSIKDLKATIRELRRKQWQTFWGGPWQRWLARMETQRTLDEQQVAQGNRGLVVRNGLSTLGSRTTLQVRVLDPQT